VIVKVLSKVLFLTLVLGGSGILVLAGDAMPSRFKLLEADVKAYQLFPEAFAARAGAALPVDESGLIGRNRQWGAFFSPRFQLGAGAALRTAIAAGRPEAAARAFRAIEVAAKVVEPDGYVPSRLPPGVMGSEELSRANITSAAAFFLGDACLGLLALEAFDQREEVVTSERWVFVRDQLVLALGWLLTQEQRLKEVDGSAPNRLLFNARAFQACGALSLDKHLSERSSNAARRFVKRALVLQAPDGHFIEGGGQDTSYQGVALAVGEDILLAGFEGEALPGQLASAAQWLADRVGQDGRVNSTGNRRTCGGGEAFLGEPKQLDLAKVFAGLVYAGVRTGQQPLLEAAGRIALWWKTNPGEDPCFPLMSRLSKDQRRASLPGFLFKSER